MDIQWRIEILFDGKNFKALFISLGFDIPEEITTFFLVNEIAFNNSKLLEYDYYDVENYNVKCFNNTLNTNQVLI